MVTKPALNPEQRLQLATLLRRASDLAISEKEFWEQIDLLRTQVSDPLLNLIYGEAHHFWGATHRLNLLFIPKIEDPSEQDYYRRMFLEFANCLEENCSVATTKERIDTL